MFENLRYLQDMEKSAVIIAGCFALVTSYIYFLNKRKRITPDKKRLVVITGCDSGFGYSIALHYNELGFLVLATVLDENSKGSKRLTELSNNEIKKIRMDMTKPDDVEGLKEMVNKILNSNPDIRFHGLVNNAGVMVFGEFEWLTKEMIEVQIQVNLIGTIRVTQSLLPVLRQHHGRLVVVNSHCGLQTLPGLNIYGATKQALRGWADALRIELAKFHVVVISIYPGSFAFQSQIMLNQQAYFDKMFKQFTSEQHVLYDDYFKRYNNYISGVARRIEKPEKIVDDGLYRVFTDPLLDLEPKPIYKNEPIKYWVYHNIFSYAPIKIRDRYVVKFMKMPTFVE